MRDVPWLPDESNVPACRYHSNPRHAVQSKLLQVIAKKRKATSRKPERGEPPCEVAIPAPTIYVLSKHSPRSLNLSVELTSTTSLRSVTTSALLDSGATGMFIGCHFVRKHNLETSPLAQPVPVHNVDGTLNENGSITEEVEVLLRFGRHTEQAQFAVANLGCQTVIIGHSWLLHHNPEVDWVKQKVTLSWCPPACNGQSPMPKLGTQGEPDFMLEPGDGVYAAVVPPEWGHELQATSTPSQ